ncbi:glycosyltransferase family 2 protein [Actinospica sp.]|uniref:glycosyltransferase family 2 protein n=1 Tax=Actinospica sp. TaxID=1872142 RepID=UPI002B7E463C|nr:glycosyltransferase family 2 protein [Actinospica sp.]HWG23593.1 glycosyltransferase family 2 protein [Actinospica sp.]
MTVLEDRPRPKPLLAGHQDADTGMLPIIAPDDPIAAPATEVAQWALWFSRIGLFAVAVVIAVERPGPWLPAAAFAFALGLAWVAGWRGRQLRNIAFALAVFTSGVNYLSWRFTVIAIGGHPLPGWIIGIPLYLAEMHAAIHTMGLHIGLWPRNPPAEPEAYYGRRFVPEELRVDPFRYPVYVFVPTVDEGEEVLRPTLTGIRAARDAYLAQHPYTDIVVVVCDDGYVAKRDTVPEISALCEEFGVLHVVRTIGGGAKAGNINNARTAVGAEGDVLLCIFDCDQIPREDFFLKLIPGFDDPDVGWVQSGQFYGNRKNPVARWADDQQSLFYRLLCPGKAAHNAAFICGTNFLMRATAIDSIGGIPTGSITEDFAASIRMAANWRSVYFTGILAVGLGPLDLASFFKQQDRWARGTLNILWDHWRDLLLPAPKGKKGLTAQQRAHYLLATTHYWCGVRDLIFCIAPILFVLTGISGVRGATATDFLLYFVPYFALSIAGFWHAAWDITSWRCIIINYGSFPVLLQAAFRVVIGRKGDFTLTPKKRGTMSPWRTAQLHLIVVAGCLVAMVKLALRPGGSAYWLAGFWLLYLCVMSGMHMILVVLDTRQARQERREAELHGGEVPLEALIPRPDQHQRRHRTPRPARRLPKPRTAFAGVVVGGAMLFVLDTSAVSASSAPLHLTAAALPAHPYIGVGALATPYGGTGVEAIEKQLGVTFETTARTQEIGDSFDYGWADSIAANGGVPWLTIVFSNNGKASLTSALTAIANGSDDNQINTWAREIAAYGRPLYLTVLPQTDRNYSASSGVANGGIPQDVPRAWARIRNLFTQAGATNVSWVWTPADPGDDQLYTPPASQVDAVALTLAEFPKTTWVDPAKELAAAAARHPGKQLMLQVSLDGTPAQRVAWLKKLQVAVAARDDVAAVVYQEAGPVSDLTGKDAKPWALTADKQTVAQFQNLAAAMTKVGNR